MKKNHSGLIVSTVVFLSKSDKVSLDKT